MKATTTVLYDERGEPLAPAEFASLRLAREAEEENRKKLLAVLGWNKNSAKLAELAWFVRSYRPWEKGK